MFKSDSRFSSASREGVTSTLTVRRSGATFTFSVVQNGVATVITQQTVAGLGALTGVQLSAWSHNTPLNTRVDNVRLAPPATPAPPPAPYLVDDFNDGVLDGWTATSAGGGTATASGGAVSLAGPATGFTSAGLSHSASVSGDFELTADFTPLGADGSAWRQGFGLSFAGGSLTFIDVGETSTWMVIGPGGWPNDVRFNANVAGTASREGVTSTLTVRRSGATFTFSVVQNGVATVITQQTVAGLGALTGVQLSAWSHNTPLNTRVDNVRLAPPATSTGGG